MASVTVKIQCRLRPHARLLLHVAAQLARVGLRIPHRWVTAVTNRNWQARVGDTWRPIRIDNQGRVI